MSVRIRVCLVYGRSMFRQNLCTEETELLSKEKPT